MNINYCLIFFMMNVLNSSLVLLNSSKPVMATIALAFSFLNTSFVLIVMNFEFIALIIIIVYIGAIIILFLFTIMLLHIKDDVYSGRNENAMLYFTFSFLYFFYFFIIMLMISEGENLEDLFINTTIDLTNSFSMNNFVHQKFSNVQDSGYPVRGLYTPFETDWLFTFKIYRVYLDPSQGGLRYSNINDLLNFYSTYDLLSRDPTLCFREITRPYPLHPGIDGQMYFSYLELPESDINTSLTHGLHDYRQYLWEHTEYEPNFKLRLRAGDPSRTDAVMSAMRFLDYFRNALNDGFLKTYNLTNPTLKTYYPKEVFNWSVYDLTKTLIREHQVQVDFGTIENYGTGIGMKHDKGFRTENGLVVSKNCISDLFSSFNFIGEQSLTNESLSIRSCNKDLELETELQSLGIVLYTIGCVYFILASVILLIALIGSVVLITSDSTEFIEVQQMSNQMSKKSTF